MNLKMLVVSDIHNQEITLRNILSEVQRFEASPTYCLIAGDITNFGSIEDLNNILSIITSNFKNTMFISGNCDPYFETDEYSASAKYIEAKPHELGFFTTVGFGGHNPSINHRILKKLKKNEVKVCLLTHAPPYGTSADMVSLNRHGGSKEVRNAIARYSNIFLAISGHIHESPTISSTNGCTIVNPGPITRGNFAIINVKRDFQVTGKIYNIHEMGK